MEPASWNPAWVHEHAAEQSMQAFRMVETQHVAATMRLVDSADEQLLLEDMLESSKPPLPAEAAGLHCLLAAPFRYVPQTPSRFRAAHMPGIWYGADDAFCACAEIAYWRQRFLLDSVGLMKQQLSTELSLYEAWVEGRAIDLLAPPWLQAHEYWAHPSDYTHTHQLGQQVRQTAPEVQWIRYASVRAADHVCAAVFDPRCLSMVSPEGRYEQWHCHATHDRVTLSNGRVRFDF